MRCPYCEHADSKVVDSRELPGSIRRRRECLGCGTRFTTFERAEFPALMVVKKDGRREPFDRQKLLVGVRKACEKRPLSVQAVERIAEQVEADLQRRNSAEVSSRLIGELAMDELREVDEIAYIRFASVYREFEDTQTLREELERLDARPRRQRRDGSQQLPLLSPDGVRELTDSPGPDASPGRPPRRVQPRLIRRQRRSA